MAKKTSALIRRQNAAVGMIVRKAESECIQRLLCLFMIALNDTEGISLGKTRITKIMRKLSELSAEYYALRVEDEDTANALIERRLNSIYGEDEFKILTADIKHSAEVYESN